MDPIAEQLEREVVRAGICVSCGACAAMDESGASHMVPSPRGPLPQFGSDARLPQVAWDACPGKGIDYPELYRRHYGGLPDSWLVGPLVKVRTGHAADPLIRARGASGGVTTQVLVHLLEAGLVDAAVVARQGVPTALEASPMFAASREAVLAAAQSVYIPVAMLEALRAFEPGKRYAMTLVPEQAAALRWLQSAGDQRARQVRYVLGPYTGTALYPAAIDTFLRSQGVPHDDAVTNLEWRAGEWPGYLEVRTAGGRVLRSKKIYYNFLIPFFVTQASLQSMDFANEFCDLSVGDAWSPKFEAAGGGHSVVVTRSAAMEAIIAGLVANGTLALEEVDPLAATEMHGHMIDFKKRGGFIRNGWRRALGLRAPDYHLAPDRIPPSRYVVEAAISGLFLAGRTGVARWLVAQIPERVIGPVFNRARLSWKALSKPTKRKGLAGLTMQETRSE